MEVAFAAIWSSKPLISGKSRTSKMSTVKKHRLRKNDNKTNILLTENPQKDSLLTIARKKRHICVKKCHYITLYIILYLY